MMSFTDCTGLTALNLPSTLSTISPGAFYNCSGLTNVVIPSSVTQIMATAFKDCTKLKSFDMRNVTGACTISNEFLNKTPKLTTFYAPQIIN
jgi:hypothetical protein